MASIYSGHFEQQDTYTPLCTKVALALEFLDLEVLAMTQYDIQ